MFLFKRDELIQVKGEAFEHFFDARACEGFDVGESAVKGSFDYSEWSFALAANL